MPPSKVLPRPSAARARARTVGLADDPAAAAHYAELLRALGHQLRLRLIACLAEADATVGELGARLETRQPIVSQQLRILRMSGLVGVTRDRFARYRLLEPGLRGLLECIEHCPAPSRPESGHGS